MAAPRARSGGGKARGLLKPKHRRSFEDDALLHDVLDLLSVVFPFFREQEHAAREIGLRWEDCSTPFVLHHRGALVSHVGLMELPLVLGGRETKVGAVHAVATHPDFRRRGFFASIMEELLSFCEDRYETLQLCTDNPEYFERFGFRLLSECHFVADRPTAPPAPPVVPLAQRSTLRRALARREPVSRLLGVRDPNVFLFNEARHDLFQSDDLEAVLCYDVEGDVLKLWDVVAPKLPPLPEIVRRIEGPYSRVEVHFPPDKLEAGLSPELDPEDEDVLMVRGPYPPEGRPFKLPATARC